MKNLIMICTLLLLSLAFSGCASLGKGIAEAVLEKTEEKDVRVCQVWGKPFSGLEAALNATRGETKVLMVHGVGNHLPGYSTEFLEKLGKELDLGVKARYSKNIALSSPKAAGRPLGNLRISRLMNALESRELLFYELTWSEITQEEKAMLAFDNSGEASFRRTEVNNLMKQFANDTGPDPIIYLGKSHGDILTAFGQSFCWMTRGDWDNLPDGAGHVCSLREDISAEQIEFDDYVMVSHSLGSRIVIDGMQLIASSSNDEIGKKNQRMRQEIIEAFRHQEIPIFMLSNQLPMLQLGRELPAVVGKKREYCEPDGKHYASRLVSKTSIIAFSDPNDLLSYSIPSRFADKYLDSRLCVEITNININIANIIDVFGIGEVANPLEAHIGYDTDARVVGLIAKGIGNHHVAPIVKERCEWTELRD
jgi:hypothetical protein